jgi:carbonic anhydrase
MVDHSKKWAYSESFLWGNDFSQCSNLNQSPINLDTSDLKECRTMCNIKHRIKESLCFVGYKNKTITIKYDDGSYTEFEDTLYELNEISIHTPSLHTIDGQKFDLEICMVHKLTDNSSENSGLIISCMFERGPDFGKPEEFISQIINHIPIDELDYDKEIKVSLDWNASWVIPKESGYFSYTGSLPYPPCQEGYKVFVYEKIGTIGETNIETFKRYLGNNSRPIRPLGQRTVFYTPYMKTLLSEKKVFKSTNKYLKCYREKVSKKITPTESISTESVIQDGLSESSITLIRNIFLLIIVLLIIANSYYFVKFLFRHFYVQKALRMFGGKENIKKDTVKIWKSCQGTIVTAADKQQMKKAAEQAQNAINSTSMMSGMGSQGIRPTSMNGLKQMTDSQGYGSSRSGSSRSGSSRSGSRGMGSQGYGSQGMYGSTTMPSGGIYGQTSSSYPSSYGRR